MSNELTAKNQQRCRRPSAESFYDVNYGSSTIASEVCQIISLIKSKTPVFPLSSRQNMNWNAKMNYFWIILSLETPVFNVFITDIFWQTFDVLIDDP